MTVIEQVHSFLEDGVPVIFCEPSSASVFRDEALALFPTDRDVERMGKLSYEKNGTELKAGRESAREVLQSVQINT